MHPRFDARFTDTTVFIFNRRRDSQPYFELLLNQPRTNAPGAFVAQPDGTAAIVIDAARALATDRTIKHELMHNILATSGTRLPLWLEEGIAEYFSTTVVRDNSVTIGRPIMSHYRSIRARGVLPTEDFLAARQGSAIASHPSFYPQCWLLVEWMMRTNRKAFYAYVSDLEQGMPPAESFRRHFGLEIGTVARTFRLLTARPSAANTVQADRKPVAVSTTQISSADALYELGRFLGGMNHTRNDAEQYLRAALELDAKHARSIAGIGALRAYERDHAGASDFFEEALAMAPNDPIVQTLYAEALLQNAIGPSAGVSELDAGATDRFRRARELVIAARQTQPSPLADAILGTTYLVEDDPSPGIEHLERARAERPARVDFALNLYALYLQAGRSGDAEALFDSVLKRSKSPQAAHSARAIYARERLAEANRLARAERVEDAAAIVQQLIETTEDETTKAKLREQHRKLTNVVAVNRDITAYNDAVSAYNAGKLEIALEKLDSLLTFVSDDEIRAKAAQLRTTVRRRLGM